MTGSVIPTGTNNRLYWIGQQVDPVCFAFSFLAANEQLKIKSLDDPDIIAKLSKKPRLGIFYQMNPMSGKIHL